MLTLTKPTAEQIDRFLRRTASLPFTYPGVGGTRWGSQRVPPGFDCDSIRVRLGSGSETFARAMQAINEWNMFPPEMCSLYWPSAPIREGATVAVGFRAGPFWSLNACRIAYVVDEATPHRRYGFAYGTLPGHLEHGEERFIVEHLPDDSVWYALDCFSRPQAALCWLGYPFARREQARFRRLSARAMQCAVSSPAASSSRAANCA